MISIRPLLAVAVAVLAALAVLLLNKREKLRDAVSPLAAIAMFAIVIRSSMFIAFTPHR